MDHEDAYADADIEVVPAPATRTERRDAIVADYRARMSKRLTPIWVWLILGTVYTLAMGGCLAIPDAITGLLVAIALTIGAWVILARLRRRDRAVAILALMTPVVDRTTLEGEIRILSATVDSLVATMSNPNADAGVRNTACARVRLAAGVVMARGGTTEETASVPGYPPHPEVDRSEIHHGSGDYASLHLVRMQATCERLAREMEDPLILAENVSIGAGEIIPPLRAIETVIAGG